MTRPVYCKLPLHHTRLNSAVMIIAAEAGVIPVNNTCPSLSPQAAKP